MTDLRALRGVVLLNLAFLVAVLLIVLVTAESYRSNQDLSRSQTQVLETVTALDGLQDLMTLMLDMETAERGFVMTGDETFLAPYERAQPRLATTLQGLEAGLSRPDHRRLLGQLGGQVLAKADFVADVIRLRREQGEDAAQAMVAGGDGQRKMERLRQTLQTLAEQKQTILAERIDEAQTQIRRTNTISLGGGAIALLLIIAAAVLINLALRDRRRLAGAALAGQARLQALINALPDRLYRLDAAGDPVPLGPGNTLPADPTLHAKLVMARDALQDDAGGPVARHWQQPDSGRWYELRMTRVSAGEYLSIVRDITGVRDYQQRIEDNEAFLRTVIDTDNNLIFVKDADGRFLLCNAAFAATFGLRPEDVEGRLQRDLGSDLVLMDQYLDDDQEIVRNNRPLLIPEQHVRFSDGSEHWIRAVKAPLNLSDGNRHILGVATDITEQRQARQIKSEFVSTVSHELRTPLTSIRGALGLLRGDPAAVAEDYQPMLALAERNCERLISLINDILDVERLQAGRMDLLVKDQDLEPVLDRAVYDNQPFADQYGIHLSLDTRDSGLRAVIDGDRLLQVLTNLISNAVKFSPRGETVCLRAERIGPDIRLSVIDHGRGIPPEFHPRIFQRFSQADASDSREKGGTGLGLNISRQLTEMMGGQIGFDSEPGRGSTFFLRFPATARHADNGITDGNPTPSP